jgi:hypothetical protein
MEWTWPCWRLITEDKASFTEVRDTMSIVDVMKLNEAVNIVYTARNEANKS